MYYTYYMKIEIRKNEKPERKRHHAVARRTAFTMVREEALPSDRTLN